jgi:beta-glucosidase
VSRDWTDALAALAHRFPPGFAWGAATSSYQVEGAVRADGRGASIWDTFTRVPGAIRGGDTGDVAADHYHRLVEDLDLMAELGLRAYRFSVAWPRIQPDGIGSVNPAGLDFYDRLVDGLLARGIEPWLTLYHWDLPQALEDRGGWPWRGIVDGFAAYAGVVAARLGDRVSRWMTINEPQVVATHGYGEGVHAPGRHDWHDALLAAHHLHLAHRAADAAIRREAPGARVGIAFNLAPVRPASDEPEDRAAAVRRDGALNRWYVDPAFGRGYPADLMQRYGQLLDGIDPGEVAGPAPPLDFVGINYYAPEVVRAPSAPHGDPVGAMPAAWDGPVSGLGWPIDASGLGEVVERVGSEYGAREIAITENGAAFEDAPELDGTVDDELRRAYMADHITAAADALGAGAPLIGYFAWALVDNFEWQLGYAARFGIVHVDWETQRRTVKASGRWYQALLRAGRRPG